MANDNVVMADIANREPRGMGAGLEQRPAPIDLLALVRLLLLKVPHLPKIAPTTGEQVFITWTWRESFKFKANVQTSDNVENGINSFDDNKVGYDDNKMRLFCPKTLKGFHF